MEQNCNVKVKSGKARKRSPQAPFKIANSTMAFYAAAA
jgi:hypothetical protein